MDNNSTTNLHAAVLKKIADLTGERERLRAEIVKLSERDRAIDREFADVRATVRLFHLDIEVPGELEQSSTHSRVVRLPNGALARRIFDESNRVISERILRPAKPEAEVEPAVNPVQPAAAPPRPAIRDIVLDRLKDAGEAGTSSAAIRRYIERVYNDKIHEKTVGMTLYRLSKRGAVVRNGSTWFLARPQAGTRNPGGEAPGSEVGLDRKESA